MADLLEERADDFARTESRNTGKPLKFSSAFDVPLTIDNLRFFAAAARNLEGKASGEYLEGLTSTIRREPIGVCASIAPWNYPLNMAAWKIGPALAAGNTVVLKPAELTPLTALMLGRLALDAGLPPGVLNVIPGPGPEVGGVLARHEDVALISVTGSTRTGASVMREAAGTVKRVHMELGGKAPFVVFADADLEAAAEGAIVGAFANCGQDCTAATRIYVDDSVRDAFMQRFLHKVDRLVVGDPMDDVDQPRAARLVCISVTASTPSSSAPVAAGATAERGGELPDGPGAYYPPTVITGAAQDSEIVQNEVFGPVVCVLGFDSRRRGVRARPTTRATASPPRPGRATSSAPSAPPASWRPARSGSTSTWRSDPRCPTAGSRAPASARTCPCTRSRSTRRSSTWSSSSPALPRKDWYDAVSTPEDDMTTDADIHLERVTKRVRRDDGGRRPDAVDPARRVLRAARPLRLRQDHHAADGRRLRGPDRGPHLPRRRRRHAAAAVQARRQHGLPVVRAVPAPDRREERRRSGSSARRSASPT